MVENNHTVNEEFDRERDESKIGRRKFLGATAAAPYAAKMGGFDLQFTRTTAGPVTVSTEAELNDALGQHSEISLANDITLTKTLQEDLGSSDLTLDLSLYSLIKGDGVNARTVELTTTGNIEIRNGTIDCNRDGQNFPTVKTKEVNLFGGQTCHIDDVKIVDNSNYGFAVEDFDEAIFDSAQVDSNAELLADSSNAAGIDGIHTFDCPTVEIRNPNIKSGDDAIGIAANDKSVEKAVISGGSVSSPVYANGIRLHVQSGAAPDTTISNVEIDSDVRNCNGQGIIIANESENGNVIQNIAIRGTVRGTGNGGILSVDPVENVSITADISDTGANGVNISGGGDTIAIDASISGADVNGIHAEDTQDVVVTGSSIEDCGNWPIISKGSSNNWVVTENSWRKNRFATVSLANDDNLVAFNSSG